MISKKKLSKAHVDNNAADPNRVAQPGEDTFSSASFALQWSNLFEQVKSVISQMMLLCRDDNNDLACQEAILMFRRYIEGFLALSDELKYKDGDYGGDSKDPKTSSRNVSWQVPLFDQPMAPQASVITDPPPSSETSENSYPFSNNQMSQSSQTNLFQDGFYQYPAMSFGQNFNYVPNSQQAVFYPPDPNILYPMFQAAYDTNFVQAQLMNQHNNYIAHNFHHMNDGYSTRNSWNNASNYNHNNYGRGRHRKARKFYRKMSANEVEKNVLSKRGVSENANSSVHTHYTPEMSENETKTSPARENKNEKLSNARSRAAQANLTIFDDRYRSISCSGMDRFNQAGPYVHSGPFHPPIALSLGLHNHNRSFPNINSFYNIDSSVLDTPSPTNSHLEARPSSVLSGRMYSDAMNTTNGQQNTPRAVRKPGQIYLLHERLSSPSRIKRNTCSENELREVLDEKLVRAEANRLRLVAEQKKKLQDHERRIEEQQRKAEEIQEQRQEELRAEIEGKMEKAEENRKNALGIIIRKAATEGEKVQKSVEEVQKLTEAQINDLKKQKALKELKVEERIQRNREEYDRRIAEQRARQKAAEDRRNKLEAEEREKIRLKISAKDEKQQQFFERMLEKRQERSLDRERERKQKLAEVQAAHKREVENMAAEENFLVKTHNCGAKVDEPLTNGTHETTKSTRNGALCGANDSGKSNSAKPGDVKEIKFKNDADENLNPQIRGKSHATASYEKESTDKSKEQTWASVLKNAPTGRKLLSKKISNTSISSSTDRAKSVSKTTALSKTAEVLGSIPNRKSRTTTTNQEQINVRKDKNSIFATNTIPIKMKTSIRSVKVEQKSSTCSMASEMSSSSIKSKSSAGSLLNGRVGDQLKTRLKTSSKEDVSKRSTCKNKDNSGVGKEENASNSCAKFEKVENKNKKKSSKSLSNEISKPVHQHKVSECKNVAKKQVTSKQDVEGRNSKTDRDRSVKNAHEKLSSNEKTETEKIVEKPNHAGALQRNPSQAQEERTNTTENDDNEVFSEKKRKNRQNSKRLNLNKKPIPATGLEAVEKALQDNPVLLKQSASYEFLTPSTKSSLAQKKKKGKRKPANEEDFPDENQYHILFSYVFKAPVDRQNEALPNPAMEKEQLASLLSPPLANNICNVTVEQLLNVVKKEKCVMAKHLITVLKYVKEIEANKDQFQYVSLCKSLQAIYSAINDTEAGKQRFYELGGAEIFGRLLLSVDPKLTNKNIILRIPQYGARAALQTINDGLKNSRPLGLVFVLHKSFVSPVHIFIQLCLQKTLVPRDYLRLSDVLWVILSTFCLIHFNISDNLDEESEQVQKMISKLDIMLRYLVSTGFLMHVINFNARLIKEAHTLGAKSGITRGNYIFSNKEYLEPLGTVRKFFIALLRVIRTRNGWGNGENKYVDPSVSQLCSLGLPKIFDLFVDNCAVLLKSNNYAETTLRLIDRRFSPCLITEISDTLKVLNFLFVGDRKGFKLLDIFQSSSYSHLKFAFTLILRASMTQNEIPKLAAEKREEYVEKCRVAAQEIIVFIGALCAIHDEAWIDEFIHTPLCTDVESSFSPCLFDEMLYCNRVTVSSRQIILPTLGIIMYKSAKARQKIRNCNRESHRISNASPELFDNVKSFFQDALKKNEKCINELKESAHAVGSGLPPKNVSRHMDLKDSPYYLHDRINFSEWSKLIQVMDREKKSSSSKSKTVCTIRLN